MNKINYKIAVLFISALGSTLFQPQFCFHPIFTVLSHSHSNRMPQILETDSEVNIFTVLSYSETLSKH